MNNINKSISESDLKEIKFALETQLENNIDLDREMLREAAYDEDWELANSITTRVVSTKEALKIVTKLLQDCEKEKISTRKERQKDLFNRLRHSSPEILNKHYGHVQINKKGGNENEYV